MEHLIQMEQICMYFGGVHAVENMNLHLAEKEILGIIGPNGSGKSTLINVLTGIYAPTSGHVLFGGEDITGRQSYEIAAKGISRTFQNLRIFRAMTVCENVMTGRHCKVRAKFVDILLRTAKYRSQEREALKKADELLEFVGLSHMKNEFAGSMSYGQQKRLEVARALASEPKVCLFDEPAAGMNSAEANEMMDLIRAVQKERGLAIILIEHNMEAMMNTAERIIVMDAGHKVAEGTPKEIQRNQKVIQIYLGEEEPCC